MTKLSDKYFDGVYTVKNMDDNYNSLLVMSQSLHSKHNVVNITYVQCIILYYYNYYKKNIVTAS